jgi:hypothetical protein
VLGLTLLVATVLAGSVGTLLTRWRDGGSSPGGEQTSAVVLPPAAGPSATLVTRRPSVRNPSARTSTPPSAARSATPSRAPSARPTASANRPDPAARPRGVRSDLNDKCLDEADGAAVMAPCGSATAWLLAADGTVRSGDRCLEVRDSGTDDGTDVLVTACDADQPGQGWRLNPARTLINPNADKCLDIRDRDVTDGAAIQLWTCFGSGNQRWTLA